MAIEVAFEDASGWLVARVEGSLDRVGAPQLSEQVVGRAPRLLALDLSEVGFIDSSGVALLLSLGERHERVVLVSPSGVVRRVLSVLGLVGDVEVVDGLGDLPA